MQSSGSGYLKGIPTAAAAIYDTGKSDLSLLTFAGILLYICGT